MVPGETHSDDLVAVFHGYAEPAIACGFHVQSDSRAVYDAHRALMEGVAQGSD